MRPIIGFLLLLYISAFSQTVNKVLISGIAGYEEHDMNVKSAFEQGYSSYDGSTFGGEITLYPQSIYNSFNYASTNNYEVIIRSTTGLASGIYYANYFPNVKLFMPAGSNDFVLCYNGDIPTCPVIVSGAGLNVNATGFKIDFFAIDPMTESNFSSFSNGYVAGQIVFLANTLDCTIVEARNYARQNASENGVWDYHNGYGKIDIGKTINNALPVELSSFEAFVENSSVVLVWQTETELNNYGFEINRALRNESSQNLEWNNIGFVPGAGNSNKPLQYSFSDNDFKKNSVYSYRLRQLDNDGKYEYSQIVEVAIHSPGEYSLNQNYPNPFNPSTTIEYQIPDFVSGFSQSNVKLFVYDILGKEIGMLVNEEQSPGMYKVIWNAGEYSSGIYIYQLQVSSPGEANTFIEKRKMILMR